MNKLEYIVKGDERLLNEIKSIIYSGENLPLAKQRGIDRAVIKDLVDDLSLADKMPIAEAVILPFMRPVLFIKNGKIELPDSNELKERILKYRSMIEQPLDSVGRIELKNHQMKNVGTGWLIADNIIVTNRHVAEFFAVRNSQTAYGGVFRKTYIGETLQAFIDFKEEFTIQDTIDNQFEVEIEKIIYLPDASKDLPDIAFLKIKKNNNLPNPVPFVKDKLFADQNIGVVGYPQRDPRGVTDPEMESRIFGNIFGVKRYSPGQVLNVPESKWYFTHDASTLGGNSGSLVQDMESGCAIGLHFGGLLLEANYAVKGSELLDIASQLKINNVFSFSSDRTEQVVIEPDFALETPFRADEYKTRKGFQEKFLENENGFVKVKLPSVRNKADIIKLTGYKRLNVLKYTHFSVQMSANRRMCFYSAVNIDGQQYKRMKRAGWRFDPRIPREYQIMQECYGNAPKFSRGHMTRREDPNWGDLAKQGNDDSMHVTNAVPQMQGFNAGIWLTLENYALENAKHDKQKICVFTGPFLHDNDPIKFGVKVPVEFWKVIAFIHDDTDELCATGYTMSQENYLRNDEFVYGEFLTYQVPIRLIERKANISFSELTRLDPLKDDIFESISSPIHSVRQIRFY